MAAQVTEYQNSAVGLWGQLLYEAAKLGPLAQAYMAWRAAPYALSGITASGAAQVIAATDYSERATACIAQITATMVKLGFEDLVARITSQCVRQDRPDAVAKVSIEMMRAGELLAISKITNKMVENGDISDAAYICRAMADHGHQEFLEIVANEQLPEPIKNVKDQVDGAIAWVTGKSGEADNKDVGQKIEKNAKEQKKGEDEEPKSDKELESKSAPAEMTAASIA